MCHSVPDTGPGHTTANEPARRADQDGLADGYTVRGNGNSYSSHPHGAGDFHAVPAGRVPNANAASLSA